jgi:hypothetical protein
MSDSTSVMVSDSERKRLKQLVEFRRDPIQGVRKMKTLRLASWTASFLILLAVFLFYKSVPELIRILLLLFGGSLLGLNVFQGQSIANVPLTLKIVDWDKIDKILKEDSNKGLPNQAL